MKLLRSCRHRKPYAARLDFAAFIRHMRRDKKVLEGKLRLVLPVGIGQALVVADVTDAQLMAVIESGRDQ